MGPQEPKDVRKLATKIEQETARLLWLETHSADLLAAFVDS